MSAGRCIAGQFDNSGAINYNKYKCSIDCLQLLSTNTYQCNTIGIYKKQRGCVVIFRKTAQVTTPVVDVRTLNNEREAAKLIHTGESQLADITDPAECTTL